MPRPKKPGAPEPKKRSRNGCWNCKARKVKCGEERPTCVNCQRTGEECDYSIRLNWEGRRKKNPGFETILFQTPSESSSSTASHPRHPSDSRSEVSASTAPTTAPSDGHRSPSATSPGTAVDLKPPSSLPPRTKPPLPGTGVFTQLSHSAAPSDGEPSPVSQTNPIFALPRPPSSSTTIPGGYVTLSESGSRPPPHKRLRYSVDIDLPPPPPPQQSSPVSLNDYATPRFLGQSGLTPGSTSTTDSPLTPAASSPYSEDGMLRGSLARQATTSLSSPDMRRMSVSSLLSGPPGPGQYAPPSQRTVNAKTNLCLSEVTTFYGVDPGSPDLDLGPNDDANAIQGLRLGNGIGGGATTPTADGSKATEWNSTLPRGYYERPVRIEIPRDLEPLPAKLRDNPMNLLYFHHFMNHTARALVPHDDQQSNPFRHVLPQMAVKNDNLLSLLLAYSASHRAHLLSHREPSTRIAHWVQDIFPALRNALNDPNQSISNANIATGILLASLEIVSPTAFGYQIPWQRHLGLARDLIASRPDGIRWTRDWTEEDQVRAFLWSWLAYLDVVGALSGGSGSCDTAWILEYQKDEYEEEWDEIDCIMGMTTRGVYVLAKIAALIRECASLRDSAEAWELPKDIVTRAWALEDEASQSMAHPPQPCKHLHASGNVAHWDRAEIAALNEAFHWAGLVHLHRRVLGRESGHEDVQAAVAKIHVCLDVVRYGGKAEATMLFPLVTAACETWDSERRALVRERLESMRMRSGFLQVDRARGMVEAVWAEGGNWEEVVGTEFIG